MRAFLELIEADRVYLPGTELPPMDPSLLSALRGEGILRDGGPGMVEPSPTDLGRTLRKLHGILSRGWTLPSMLDAREILLVARPPRGLAWALRRAWRSLVLVPTSRSVTGDMRKRHGPGTLVEVEALEETLVARGGRLSRRKGEEGPTRASAPARGGRTAAKGREASPLERRSFPWIGDRRKRLGGARRWRG